MNRSLPERLVFPGIPPTGQQAGRAVERCQQVPKGALWDQQKAGGLGEGGSSGGIELERMEGQRLVGANTGVCMFIELW